MLPAKIIVPSFFAKFKAFKKFISLPEDSITISNFELNCETKFSFLKSFFETKICLKEYLLTKSNLNLFLSKI